METIIFVVIPLAMMSAAFFAYNAGVRDERKKVAERKKIEEEGKQAAKVSELDFRLTALEDIFSDYNILTEKRIEVLEEKAIDQEDTHDLATDNLNSIADLLRRVDDLEAGRRNAK